MPKFRAPLTSESGNLTPTGAGDDFVINAGAPNNTSAGAKGGDVTINAGDGGDDGVNATKGGAVNINGGDSTLSLGGAVNINGGIAAGPAVTGGGILLAAGSANGGALQGAVVYVGEGGPTLNGRIQLVSDNQAGASGEAFVSDGGANGVWGGIIIAAGVPSGAPDGMLPFAIDTTSVTGGFYYWSGSAWVKIVTIP